jgi:hypothetical protein
VACLFPAFAQWCGNLRGQDASFVIEGANIGAVRGGRRSVALLCDRQSARAFQPDCAMTVQAEHAPSSCLIA